MNLRLILLLLLVTLAFTSCLKNVQERLAGEWELRHREGGLLPSSEFMPGNGNSLKFTDTAYERIENGKVVETGTYTIINEETTISNVKVRYKIIFGNKTDSPVYLKQLGDKLTLFVGNVASDGTVTVYYKL
jgi:hypothetical protein